VTVAEAIDAAEGVLPGSTAPDGAVDPRWQAIIAVGVFVETDAATIWPFIRRWGAHDDPDLRAAIATCLLEHLLEQDGPTYRPLAESAARDDTRFADTLRRCWTFREGSRERRGPAALPSE
jgi:hypothetical protein